MSQASWRRVLVAAMLLSLAWALMIWVGGGVSWETSAFRVSSHDPLRPLGLAFLSAIALWYLAPEAFPDLARRLERLTATKGMLLAAGAAALTTGLGLHWGTFAAGGSDSYGYVSQADLWLSGHLKIDQSWLQPLPWPISDEALAPLGYRPGPSSHTIVPTYAPGLSLLMAAGKAGGGSNGVYWVGPVLGGLAVFLTFLLGRLLFDETVGVSASFLLAASPTFVFMLLCPLSDVPVAAAWTLAIVFGVLARPFAAGLASSLAIVIRPNLLLLAVAVAVLAIDLFPNHRIRALMTRTALFGAGILPGVVGIALLNAYLYGGPLESGYGSLASIYHWSYLGPNLTRYTKWLVETQTPLVFAAILPLVSRRLSSAGALASSLRVRTGLALFLVLLFVSYLFYIPFDDWWYLRFLLSGFPVLLVLAVGFLRVTTRTFARTGGILLLTAVVVLVFGREAIIGRARRVYTLQRLEARYPVVGHDLAKTAPPDAIFLAMIQSGSLRLYTGRVTVRYDFLPPESLDRAIDVLRARGFHPFFLLERQEEAAFRERFGGASPTGRLDWRPVRVWNTQSEVALYDPADREKGER